jgi:hypothetical protein
VDINADLEPTYVDDAQRLERVALVLADPPYSVEDAQRYQTCTVKRNVVIRVLQRVKPETHVVWLDQVPVQYRNATFAMEAAIGMMKSTNHRFRMITVFRRRNPA